MAKYGVYIIEFLRSDDDLCDGEPLQSILTASQIPVIYKWADTKEDFSRLINDFDKSQFRYLHISCHADKKGFEINGDEISNQEIEDYTKNVLLNKRLFLSACEGANKDLASRIIIGNNAQSLLGMPIKVPFDKAALFWSSFYHVINELDSRKMRRIKIIEVVKQCVQLFKVPVNYYSRITGCKTHLRRLKVRDNHIECRKIKSTI